VNMNAATATLTINLLCTPPPMPALVNGILHT
jgi:hypothetical protein